MGTQGEWFSCPSFEGRECVWSSYQARSKVAPSVLFVRPRTLPAFECCVCGTYVLFGFKLKAYTTNKAGF